ncbi:MAG: hypothetical protein KJ626_07135 [Verrucomicrobia bacterium]|nr:hypothetical protein [Verrucomicrobiota bacterium]
MRLSKKIVVSCAILVVAGAGYLTYRGARLATIAFDAREQIRYLVESGETIGEVPAVEAFSTEYLDQVFGGSPELLGKLKGVIAKGLTEDPDLTLGEVAAMVVTYHENDQGEAEDIVAHVFGGFPHETRKPGFHRDGYFKHLLDRNVWSIGNSVISLVGRDLIMFAENETADRQEKIIESLLSGNILPLAYSLDKPLRYTAVFPDPRRVVPRQLKNHIQAVILKGTLGQREGKNEIIFLTPSVKSATYALSVLSDFQTMSEVTLKTQFKGIKRQNEWNMEIVDPWWAYEIVQTSEKSTIEKEGNIIRIRSEYGRVMVNAILKTLERMGRDMAQIRGSLNEGKDPRLVDAELKSRKHQHYWTDEHRWGPNWPIGSLSKTNELEGTDAEAPPDTATPESTSSDVSAPPSGA